VIPQITKVLTELRTGREKVFKMPTRCPVDGSPVTREGAIERCSSKMCAAQHRESLYHFVSRAAFNIEGMGPKIIDKFLDEGLISDSADIFELKKGDIAALERFGEKSAENIANEIEAKKRITLPRFLYALGILHVGEETAALLAKNFEFGATATIPIKNILKVFTEKSLEDLQEVPDIGPKVGQSIYEWFHAVKNVDLLTRLEKAGVIVEAPPARTAQSSKLAGKTFVITGSLEAMSREEAKEKIRALGGDPSESVSQKTDYLVAGSEPGSKFDKAKKLGVNIIEEEEFLKLIK
jgi:DNA ligase (NAD+)